MERLIEQGLIALLLALLTLGGAGCASGGANDTQVALTDESSSAAASDQTEGSTAGETSGQLTGEATSNAGNDEAGSDATANSGPGADPFGPPANLDPAPSSAGADGGQRDEQKRGDSDAAAAQTAETDASRDPGWTSGRPDWWIVEPRLEEGRILIAAESLRPDVLSARRSAVDAGWDALIRELPERPRDFRVEKMFLRPLSGNPGGERSARYIGYVLISAAVADGAGVD